MKTRKEMNAKAEKLAAELQAKKVELSSVEIELLLQLLYKSDAYNDGGRIAGILVNKLEGTR